MSGENVACFTIKNKGTAHPSSWSAWNSSSYWAIAAISTLELFSRIFFTTKSSASKLGMARTISFSVLVGLAFYAIHLDQLYQVVAFKFPLTIAYLRFDGPMPHLSLLQYLRQHSIGLCSSSTTGLTSRTRCDEIVRTQPTVFYSASRSFIWKYWQY